MENGREQAKETPPSINLGDDLMMNYKPNPSVSLKCYITSSNIATTCIL